MMQPFEQEEGSSLLDQISEGMTVYDPQGDQIGTVKYVYLGAVMEEEDERGIGAATTDAADMSANTLIEDFAMLFAPDPMPETLRHRLLRHGFIRIDSAGLFASDRYAMPRQIASVSGDRVTPRVSREELMKH